MSIVDLHLNQTAEFATKSGRDIHGKPIESDGVAVSVRFQETSTRVKDNTGAEITVDAEVWMQPTVSAKVDDTITFDGVKYRFVKVETKRELDGTLSHKKGYVVRVAV